MAIILQKTFSIAFSWLKIVVSFFNPLKFVLASNKQNASIGSDNDLVPNRREAII